MNISSSPQEHPNLSTRFMEIPAPGGRLGWTDKQESDASFTRKESRARTVFAAISRLGLIPNAVDPRSKCSTSTITLVIHFVGADRNEGFDQKETLNIFKPLIDNILSVPGLAELNLSLLMCGPNVPAEACDGKTTIHLTPGHRHQQLRFTTHYRTDLYHDLMPNASAEAIDYPHLVVCFNAGIWGYSDWWPSIQYIIEFMPSVPVVVTSYSMSEAEEDMDAVEERISPRPHWIWQPAQNSFRSLEVRDAQTSEIPMFENFAWQCFVSSRSNITPEPDGGKETKSAAESCEMETDK